MADTLDYQTINSPGSGRDGVGGNRRRPNLRMVLNTLIILLILFLVAELVFHFAVAPRISLKSVQLETAMEIGVEEVRNIGGIRLGSLFHTINAEVITRRLMAYPEIKEAHVQRIFPDSLRIRLSGREPLAVVLSTSDGNSVPVLIDGGAVIYRRGSEIDHWELPLVYGISTAGIEAGQSLDGKYSMVLADIRILRETAPEILKAFSEFRVDEVYPGVFEWVLVPIHHPLKVRTNLGLNRDQGLFILKVLDVLEKRRGEEGLAGIGEIDFRTGDVVYSSVRGDNGLQ